MRYRELVEFMEGERRRQNLSRAKLEEMCGVSASTMTKWSHGENKPQLEPFIMCVEALGFEIGLRRKKDVTKSNG